MARARLKKVSSRIVSRAIDEAPVRDGSRCPVFVDAFALILVALDLAEIRVRLFEMHGWLSFSSS